MAESFPTLLAWLRQRLMEAGKRDARFITQVTFEYERYDGTTGIYARPVVEGTAEPLPPGGDQ